MARRAYSASLTVLATGCMTLGVRSAEVQPGLFGARSDVRIALPPAAIDALVQRLAPRIAGAPGAPSGDAGVQRVPNAAQSVGFFKPCSTKAEMHSAGSSAVIEPAP